MATRGLEKKTSVKLFTHIENAQKKYFICLSEIRTPVLCCCLIISFQILRYSKMLNICI